MGRATAAGAAVREARAAYRPRISAMGIVQELGGGETRFSTEWQGGIQVEYPLFTGGSRSQALERSRAELEQALAEVELAARQVEEGALAASAAEEEALARAAALDQAVRSFEELVRVEALALAEGAGVQLDFLRAQAGLLEARSGRAIARRTATLAVIRRARILGYLTVEWIETLVEEGR
jgi:outer membrane protein TolC